MNLMIHSIYGLNVLTNKATM